MTRWNLNLRIGTQKFNRPLLTKALALVSCLVYNGCRWHVIKPLMAISHTNNRLRWPKAIRGGHNGTESHAAADQVERKAAAQTYAHHRLSAVRKNLADDGVWEEIF
jgi:hypothetical protein